MHPDEDDYLDPTAVARYPNGTTRKKARWPKELLDDSMPTIEAPDQLELPLPGPAQCAAVANLMAAADMGQITEQDAVTLPYHYARHKIEPIRFICENQLNFFQGNILKYIMRWDAKNGLEDLEKAQRYLTMFIKWVKGDPDWWRKEATTT